MPRKRTKDRLFVLADIGETLALLAGLLLSMVVPESKWPALTRWFVPRSMPANGELMRRRCRRLERIYGARLDADRRRQIAWANTANYYRRHLQRLRDLSPLGWRPKIAVQGLEHIEAARQSGGGLVLWISHFAFAGVGTYKALRSRGVALHHVSRPRHGLKGSRYVMQVLNPLWLKPERRNLASVIFYTPEVAAAASLQMLKRIRSNDVLSITVGHAAATLARVPFLDCHMLLASGPAELSLSTGAPLLPVFTLETKPGRLEVIIEPPLDALDAGDRRARVEAIVAAYSKRLEPYALAHPEQFLFHLLKIDER